MDWFEKITGFKEASYAETQRLLSVQDGCLISKHTETRWSVGVLEMPTLAELRARAGPLISGRAPTRVQCMAAGARELHREVSSAGALVQVASQFNLLEMVGPDVTPERGVTRYQHDPTQGPACAMAAGAATIYRNYLIPIGESLGQTAHTQIDCLSDLGLALGNVKDRLWKMRNGYALSTQAGLKHIDQHLQDLDEQGLDELRGHLRIGLQWDVDVTDLTQPGHRVSQAFCSALPVAYSNVPACHWTRFASLVLEAAYEATVLAAAISNAKYANAPVFLTSLGGGAFGNDPDWIHEAMRRALRRVQSAGLDVRIVARGSVSSELGALAAEFS